MSNICLRSAPSFALQPLEPKSDVIFIRSHKKIIYFAYKLVSRFIMTHNIMSLTDGGVMLPAQSLPLTLASSFDPGRPATQIGIISVRRQPG